MTKPITDEWRKQAIDEIVDNFEMEFGMCFQPFGDNLDNAKVYLRKKLNKIVDQATSNAREEERSKIADDLFNLIPTGDITAWELIKMISKFHKSLKKDK